MQNFKTLFSNILSNFFIYKYKIRRLLYHPNEASIFIEEFLFQDSIIIFFVALFVLESMWVILNILLCICFALILNVKNNLFVLQYYKLSRFICEYNKTVWKIKCPFFAPFLVVYVLKIAYGYYILSILRNNGP